MLKWIMSHVTKDLLPDILSIEGEGDCEIVVAPFCIESEDLLIVNGIKEYLSGGKVATFIKYGCKLIWQHGCQSDD